MKRSRTRKARRFGILLLLVLLLTGGWHLLKPLPVGLAYSGQKQAAENILFLADLTYLDEKGQRQSEQQIFDELFAMINVAQRFVLIDMFLFNSYQGEAREDHRALASQLADALIAQKMRYPEMQILVITDPINTAYGSLESAPLRALSDAGISVTYTKLTLLRDSNPIYSSVWRTFISWWGVGPGEALPNPFGEGRASVRSYLALMNFKANHRKLAISDYGDTYMGLVTSANPHDGSSAHDNVALRFSGAAVADLLETEIAVLRFSDGPEPLVTPEMMPDSTATSPTGATLQVVTERAIEEAVLDSINLADSGDQLDLAMFYLSDRDVVKALQEALARGVNLRVLLDPNKDAFGHAKNGIPNRQTAMELQKKGAWVRWCDTHGEQCHSKLLLAKYADGSRRLILGSANFTRRNLDNLNLETNVLVEGQADVAVFTEVSAWFEMLWSNPSGRQFSVGYPTYADESLGHQIMYRVMEASGLSTF